MYLLVLCLYSFAKTLDHLYYHYSEFFFWVDCLSSLPLVVLLGFFLVPLSGTYSSVVSFCDCSFHPTSCRVVVPLVPAVCPLVDEAGLRGLCRLPGGRNWVLSLWWAGPCQGVCLAGSYGLRKTLGSPSADGWGCLPTLLVVWPKASQYWSLQSVQWGQVLVRKWGPPGGLTPTSTPQNYHHQCLCPHSEPQPPPLPPQETLQYQQVGLAQDPMRSLLFPLDPGARETLCAPSKSGVSFSACPVEFL